MSWNKVIMLFFLLGFGLLMFSSPANAIPGSNTALCIAMTKEADAIYPSQIIINDLRIPMNFGEVSEVTFTAGMVNITGINTVKFSNCTVGSDFTYISQGIGKLNIEFIDYQMIGQLIGHLDLSGSGHANVMIENFFVSACGNYTEYEAAQGFNSLQLDLDMYQWTVIFENFMEGTDMGVLFNEFFSEVGPETMDAIEAVLNDPGMLNNQLLAVVNRIIGFVAEMVPDSNTEQNIDTTPLWELGFKAFEFVNVLGGNKGM